jgi:predicted cobalt transporter CbtA
MTDAAGAAAGAPPPAKLVKREDGSASPSAAAAATAAAGTATPAAPSSSASASASEEAGKKVLSAEGGAIIQSFLVRMAFLIGESSEKDGEMAALHGHALKLLEVALGLFPQLPVKLGLYLDRLLQVCVYVCVWLVGGVVGELALWGVRSARV